MSHSCRVHHAVFLAALVIVVVVVALVVVLVVILIDRVDAAAAVLLRVFFPSFSLLFISFLKFIWLYSIPFHFDSIPARFIVLREQSFLWIRRVGCEHPLRVLNEK